MGHGSVSGSGTGYIGSSIYTTGSVSGLYPQGSAFSLVATPAPGSKFVGWSGSCSGTSTCNFTLEFPVQNVTAEFEKISPHHITSFWKILQTQILAVNGKGHHLPSANSLLPFLKAKHPTIHFSIIENHNSASQVGVIYILGRSNTNHIFLERILPGKPTKALIVEISKNGSSRTYRILLHPTKQK